MNYNPETHHRKSIRIKQYNYSTPGMYFITICTQNRECTLSEIVGAGPVSAQEQNNENNPVLKLTKLGIMINETYLNLEKEYKNIKLHDYIIMPNHVHGIIEIRADTGPAPTISEIICSYKTRTTHLCAKGVNEGIYFPFNKRIWQRNYYEHIIRNEKELLKIQEYIQYNPFNWKQDEFNC